MISRRFLVPVCILLALACVPTLIHSYIGATDDDGLRTAAIPVKFEGFTSSPTARPANWGRDVFESHDWIERNYGNGAGANVRLFVARSYDAKKLYHHPELAVLRGSDLARAKAATIAIGPESVPVFVLDDNRGRGVAAYVLLYESRYISEPVKFQLETALRLLFSQRKAVTLFLAFDPTANAAAPFEKSTVASVLRSAVSAFRAQASAGSAHAPNG